MPKKEGYSDGLPKAPANKLATQPNIQNASLGNDVPKMVPTPTAPGKPQIGGIHKANKLGKLRVSGHPKAHHIGKR